MGGQEVKGHQAGAEIFGRSSIGNRGKAWFFTCSHESCCSAPGKWKTWHQAGNRSDAPIILHPCPKQEHLVHTNPNPYFHYTKVLCGKAHTSGGRVTWNNRQFAQHWQEQETAQCSEHG